MSVVAGWSPGVSGRLGGVTAASDISLNGYRYAIITAAYNEAASIEKTMESVIGQQVQPLKWVIVSDGSADGTDEIVKRYAAQHSFICYVRREKDQNRGFASKVAALAAGVRALNLEECDSIGHLDGDLSFAASYFRELLDRFRQDHALGIGGGYICEEHGGRFIPRQNNRVHSVAGAVQMFRKECYEAIGGLLPLVHGGEDWHAEVVARMNGWTVRSFPDLRVFHHRPTGSAEGRLRAWYRQGLMDYSLGSHPFFEAAKMAPRLRARPLILGALVRFCAFGWAYCRHEDRIVSKEFVKFLRREQMGRLLSFGGTLRGNRSGAGQGGELKKSDGRI